MRSSLRLGRPVILAFANREPAREQRRSRPSLRVMNANSVRARSTRLLAEGVLANHRRQLRFRQRFQMRLDCYGLILTRARH